MRRHWNYATVVGLGLFVSACVQAEGWTYTTITLPDGTVVETRHRGGVDKEVPPTFDSEGNMIAPGAEEFAYENRDVELPDGTWMSCSSDAVCEGVYSRNKSKHPANETDRGGGGGSGGD